jgi:hypothetical protein
MAFCTQCGSRLREGSAFCGECGAAVQISVTTNSQTQAVGAPISRVDTSINTSSQMHAGVRKSSISESSNETVPKSNNILIIAVICAVIIVLSLAVYFVLADKERNKTQQVTAQTGANGSLTRAAGDNNNPPQSNADYNSKINSSADRHAMAESINAGPPSRGMYLYDQLRKPAYKTAFNALFGGQYNIEPWLKGYLKSGNGVDTPNEVRVVGGKTYEFYHICQPHNCPGNVIYVFFEPGGARAWALFTKDDGTSRFFGNPDITIQTALRAEVR